MEAADTDGSHGTIRPRASPTTAMEAATRAPKRRRIEFVEELEANLDRTTGVVVTTSSVHMRTSSSCSSSNANVDLEDKLVEIGKSTYEFRKVKKMLPQEEEISTMMKRQRNSVLNREIEEFFTRTTKEQLKLFENKYNFDFDNEEPLEGSYDWINLK